MSLLRGSRLYHRPACCCRHRRWHVQSVTTVNGGGTADLPQRHNARLRLWGHQVFLFRQPHRVMRGDTFPFPGWNGDLSEPATTLDGRVGWRFGVLLETMKDAQNFVDARAIITVDSPIRPLLEDVGTEARRRRRGKAQSCRRSGKEARGVSCGVHGAVDVQPSAVPTVPHLLPERPHLQFRLETLEQLISRSLRRPVNGTRTKQKTTNLDAKQNTRIHVGGTEHV